MDTYLGTAVIFGLMIGWLYGALLNRNFYTFVFVGILGGLLGVFFVQLLVPQLTIVLSLAASTIGTIFTLVAYDGVSLLDR